ncbi:hypothetical protein [Rugamonas rubra]|uniref:Uncharacterized protein n=1 Tax=Rugamonas rubra TaxID=758825 RepID=A0A1I4SHG5_9BURK|nr:hypothetical protein [Rugamonas rubra]SFM63750.1 hypothetical protein SAMN02982985_04772 [Rugamonas rubra]
MTIRLLCAYDKYPANAIVALDAGTEAGLIAAKQATATLTGGDTYFVPVQPVQQAQPLVGGGRASIKAGEQVPISLPEGQALTITGAANTTGVAYLLDPVLGGTNSLRSWAIGAGSFTTPAYAGTQQFLISCSAGSVDVLVGAAVLNIPAPRPRDGVVILGDSTAQKHSVEVPVTIVDNGNGTATATITSPQTGQNAYTGDRVTFAGMVDSKLNQINALILSHTLSGALVTSVTYATTGPYIPVSGGFAPIMYLAWQEAGYGSVIWAKAMCGATFKIVGNYSAGGADSDGLQSVIESAMGTGASVALFKVGTNNVYARGFTADYSIASIKPLMDRCVQLGVKPVLTSIPPNTGGTGALSAKLAPVNRWAQSYLPQIGGRYVNTWMGSANGLLYADPASVVGLPSTGMLADNAHDARLGAWAGAKRIAQALLNYFPASRATYPMACDVVASGKIYFDNALLQGTAGTTSVGSGTITGTIATGLVVINSAGSQAVVCSIVPRTEAVDGDPLGNNQRLVISGLAAGSVVTVRIAVSASNYAFGDVVEGLARVRISSGNTPGSGAPLNVTPPELAVTVSTATTGADKSYSCRCLDVVTPINEAYSLTLDTPPYQFKKGGSAIHGALAFMRHEVVIYGTGAAGHVTLDIAHPMLWAVDPSAA